MKNLKQIIGATLVTGALVLLGCSQVPNDQNTIPLTRIETRSSPIHITVNHDSLQHLYKKLNTSEKNELVSLMPYSLENFSNMEDLLDGAKNNKELVDLTVSAGGLGDSSVIRYVEAGSTKIKSFGENDGQMVYNKIVNFFTEKMSASEYELNTSGSMKVTVSNAAYIEVGHDAMQRMYDKLSPEEQKKLSRIIPSISVPSWNNVPPSPTIGELLDGQSVNSELVKFVATDENDPTVSSGSGSLAQYSWIKEVDGTEIKSPLIGPWASTRLTDIIAFFEKHMTPKDYTLGYDKPDNVRKFFESHLY